MLASKLAMSAPSWLNSEIILRLFLPYGRSPRNTLRLTLELATIAGLNMKRALLIFKLDLDEHHE